MRRAITSFIVLAVVVAAFIIPSRFAKKVGDDMMAETQMAIDYINSEQFDFAQRHMKNASEIFEKSRVGLKFIVDHEEVDKMSSAIRVAMRGISLQAKDDAMFALEELAIMLKYIPLIEKPTIDNIF